MYHVLNISLTNITVIIKRNVNLHTIQLNQPWRCPKSWLYGSFRLKAEKDILFPVFAPSFNSACQSFNIWRSNSACGIGVMELHHAAYPLCCELILASEWLGIWHLAAHRGEWGRDLQPLRDSRVTDFGPIWKKAAKPVFNY